MTEQGGDVEEGETLLGKEGDSMRQLSARSFLDYGDDEGSDSNGSQGTLIKYHRSLFSHPCSLLFPSEVVVITCRFNELKDHTIP